MVDKNLIADLEFDDSQVDTMLMDQLGEAVAGGDMEGLLEETNIGDFSPGSILTGRIIGYAGDDFLVDVGLKSEGVLDKHEFEDHTEVEIGDTVEVLLEAVEGASGTVDVSKRKADRIRGWERIINEKGEGDPVEGKVMRKIKGGLLVDIGVPVFLPASQVDIRRPPDIGIYIGKTVEAQILKIDTERRNIVISRRKLIEERRA
ncbi:MAG: S1 RNA-binding domain-containing protein, partial [Planctomycetota bacterium]